MMEDREIIPGLWVSFTAAGLICFWGEEWCIHFGVRRKYRQWGYLQVWHDGPIDTFGVGPLVLMSRQRP